MGCGEAFWEPVNSLDASPQLMSYDLFMCVRNDANIITDLCSPSMTHAFLLLFMLQAASRNHSIWHFRPWIIGVLQPHHIESLRFISIVVKCSVMTLIRDRHYTKCVICRYVTGQPVNYGVVYIYEFRPVAEFHHRQLVVGCMWWIYGTRIAGSHFA